VAVIWSKDATTSLEDIRFIVADDKVFYESDNRSLDDLEQRDVDLHRIMSPGRGFRVTETTPIAATYDVEPGFYMSSGTVVARYAGSTGNAVAAAAAGKYRLDLIYFNLATGAIGTVAGVENTGAFLTTFPQLPANVGAIPLAILYVDDAGGDVSEQIAAGTAGAIEDIRLSTGAEQWTFEASSANMVKDGVASVGSLYTIARADHRHEANVDVAISPQTLNAAKAAAGSAGGVATEYIPYDHIHVITAEDSAANIKPDGHGVVPTSPNISRINHQHGTNVTSSLPARVAPSTGSAGVSTFYSRRTHVHGAWNQSLRFYSQWVHSTLTVPYVIGVQAESTDIRFDENLVIPSNTFEYGLMVEIECDFLSHSKSICYIQPRLWQGTTYKSPAGPGPFTTYTEGTSDTITGDATYLSLGFMPHIGGQHVRANSDSNWSQNVITKFYWINSTAGSAGTITDGNGSALGGLDWDNTANTYINFHKAYVFGRFDPTGDMYIRGATIRVWGF
jgi:hypothetical protein